MGGSARKPTARIAVAHSSGCIRAVIVACCLPWTVRNYNAFHKLIPIRSNFAFELWIGNNDIFDEHAVGGIQRITRYEETRKYAQLGETAYLAEKISRAKTFISNKPALFLQLTGRRIIATSFGTNHPLADFRRTDSWLVRVILLGNLLLAVGTLLAWSFAKNPQPAYVSNRRATRTLSAGLLPHAHFAALPASHRSAAGLADDHGHR